QISSELNDLSKNFGDNIVAHKKEINIFLTEEELDGVPEFVLKSAAEKARLAGKEGEFLFSPQFGNTGYISTYAKNPETRKKVYEATATLASTGKYDNTDIILEMVK